MDDKKYLSKTESKIKRLLREMIQELNRRRKNNIARIENRISF